MTPSPRQRDDREHERPEHERDDADDREPEADAGHQSAEPQIEEERAHAPKPIRLGQRILFVGAPGEGKSEGLLSLFAVHGGQRILIDVQDHFTFGPEALAEEPPPLEVDDPRAIDWQHRTIRYVVRRPGDRREMDALHAAIYRRGNLLVCADELEDIAPSQGSGASFYVRKTLKQGRKRRITYGGASQRPHGVDRSIISLAEHAHAFKMVDPDDITALSYRFGMTSRDLAAELGQLEHHAYLRHTIGDPHVLHMPPLPAAAIDYNRRHVINPEFTQR